MLIFFSAWAFLFTTKEVFSSPPPPPNPEAQGAKLLPGKTPLMRVLCRGPDGNTHGTPFQPSPPSPRRPCDETAMGQTSGTTTRTTPSPPTSYRRGSARRLSTQSSPLFQSQVCIPFAAKTAAFSSPGAPHPQTAPLVPPCKSTELAPASPSATQETNPAPPSTFHTAPKTNENVDTAYKQDERLPLASSSHLSTFVSSRRPP